MQNRRLGFVASWNMLTAERGWYKSIVVLALLSWVPLLGTIALLGYAYEWARLAAWGVDCAPRRSGIDYGKLLKTGGWAFLILVTMVIVASVITSILFGVDWDLFMPLDFGFVAPWNISGWGSFFRIVFTPRMLVGMVCQVFVGAFIIAAMLRGTIYDGFAAGWRLDRLAQMVVCDPGGFMRLVGVSAIGCAAGLMYSWASAAVMGAIASVGISYFEFYDGALYFVFNSEHLLRHLFTLSPTNALGGFLLSTAFSFIGSALSVAMQLVATHAAGMWFRRFDVGRWGLSSDPLPDGVPHEV